MDSGDTGTMETTGSYIDVIINHKFVSAFVDSGCLCDATISPSASAELPKIRVRTRRLEQVTDGPSAKIEHVALIAMDIEGHRENVHAYVIPGQHEDVILGKGWLSKHDASVRPATEEVVVRRPWRATLKTRQVRTDVREISTAALRAYRARMMKNTPEPAQRIFAATLQDLEKALTPKKHGDPLKECPTWLRPVVEAFDRDRAKELPPHRTGLDYEVNLLDDAIVPAMPLYSMSKDELLVLRKTLYELLDQGFIRASSSGAGAPVIFVKKPGGGLRFCVDYRGLNAVTKKDSYPLPRIDETLREISQAKWVSKVDVISAFHRLRIKAGHEERTAFRTRLGSYEWLVTPFGLAGAPAAFQRFINSVLQKWLDNGCSAYADDVSIYSNGTREEHRTLVKAIVKALGDAGLQLDWDKSQFEATEIKYLGYVVRPGVGLKADPEKVKAIQEWEAPKNVRGVRSFLGFGNFYRQFIDRYSELAAPLTALTKKDLKFVWSEEANHAFKRLKRAFVEAPLLTTYDPTKSTVIEADCSGWALGGAFMQRGDDQLLRPVAYHSRKLGPAEVNYPIHDKEMLAIHDCIRAWSAMLRGRTFEVWSDHKNLVHFQNKQMLAERQRRWAYELSEYDFRIIHKPGVTQAQSDALSRREQDMPQDAEDDRIKSRDFRMLEGDQDRGLVVVAKARTTDGPCTDPPLVAAKGWVSNADDGGTAATDNDLAEDHPTPPFDDDELCALWKEALKAHGRYWEARRAVRNRDKAFPKEWKMAWQITECTVDTAGRLQWRNRTWVPFYEPLRTGLIQRVHDSPLAGHPGRELTRDLVAREYCWPGLTEDVRRFVGNCQTCGKGKVWREQKRGLLKPLPVPERQWQELAMDFIVDLPSSRGFTNILGVTDRLTKSMVLIPMTTMTAEDVADAMMRHVFAHHGLPRAIVSDRGPQFVSLMWRTVCRNLDITQRLSTAFHPETDGAQERSNQEIEVYLRAFSSFSQDNWASTLPTAQLALNNRTSASTGFSPFFLTHGFHQDTVIPDRTEDVGSDVSPATRGHQWLDKQRDATAFAQAAMAIAQENQERHTNRSRQAAERFTVGDRVWLRLKNVKTSRPSKKLDWLALPYTVLASVGSHAVRLDTPPGVHPVFHVSLVKHARNDPLPSQVIDDTEPPPISPQHADDNHGEGEYTVEKILAHRKRGRGYQLLVRWTGYAEPTWEPLIQLDSTEALDAYEATVAVPWTTR